MTTYTVSYRLQRLGIDGVLVLMAESGLITELRCQMPSCYCPGGRGYFDPTSTSPNDWVPNPDHYPVAKANGGHLVPESVSPSAQRGRATEASAYRPRSSPRPMDP